MRICVSSQETLEKELWYIVTGRTQKHIQHHRGFAVFDQAEREQQKPYAFTEGPAPIELSGKTYDHIFFSILEIEFGTQIEFFSNAVRHLLDDRTKFLLAKRVKYAFGFSNRFHHPYPFYQPCGFTNEKDPADIGRAM